MHNKSVQRALKLAHVGIQFGITVIALTIGGVYLDKHFQTTPGLTLGGLALGFTAGLYHLIKETMKAQEALEKERKAAAKHNQTSEN